MKERIREAMESAGLKPLQLANAVGVSSGAVTHWLNGEVKTLKAATANRLQEVTGFSAHWILTGKGEKRGTSADAAPMPYTGPSAMGRRLALVFDMIPENDILKQDKAYQIATEAIAAILQGDAVTLIRETDQKKQG